MAAVSVTPQVQVTHKCLDGATIAGKDCDKCRMDEFGRTESERTVMLSSRDAERINNEVTDGKHDTYDEALMYVIERGFKEIERQRESAKKQEGQRLVAKAMEKFNKLLGTTPSLVANRVALSAALKATLTPAEFSAVEVTLKLMFPEPSVPKTEVKAA